MSECLAVESPPSAALIHHFQPVRGSCTHRSNTESSERNRARVQGNNTCQANLLTDLELSDCADTDLFLSEAGAPMLELL